jgi:hypothetical protein
VNTVILAAVGAPAVITSVSGATWWRKRKAEERIWLTAAITAVTAAGLLVEQLRSYITAATLQEVVRAVNVESYTAPVGLGSSVTALVVLAGFAAYAAKKAEVGIWGRLVLQPITLIAARVAAAAAGGAVFVAVLSVLTSFKYPLMALSIVESAKTLGIVAIFAFGVAMFTDCFGLPKFAVRAGVACVVLALLVQISVQFLGFIPVFSYGGVLDSRAVRDAAGVIVLALPWVAVGWVTFSSEPAFKAKNEGVSPLTGVLNSTVGTFGSKETPVPVYGSMMNFDQFIIASPTIKGGNHTLPVAGEVAPNGQGGSISPNVNAGPVWRSTQTETNTTATSGIDLGWYPDPLGEGFLRWWNGAEWSENTKPL